MKNEKPNHAEEELKDEFSDVDLNDETSPNCGDSQTESFEKRIVLSDEGW